MSAVDKDGNLLDKVRMDDHVNDVWWKSSLFARWLDKMADALERQHADADVLYISTAQLHQIADKIRHFARHAREESRRRKTSLDYRDVVAEWLHATSRKMRRSRGD